MQLIVITPDTTAANEPEVANQLLANGLQRLHLRKPGYDAAAYRAYIDAIEQQYHSRLVSHGCFDLFHEYRLGGIHLNSAARGDAAIQEQVQDIPASRISASFHSWREIIDNTFPYGYVFISPVFDSISKTGYKAGIDLAGAAATKKIKHSRENYCSGIIGLGGVAAVQLEVLHDNGFDGGAMLGGIWAQQEPIAAFIEANEMATSL